MRKTRSVRALARHPDHGRPVPPYPRPQTRGDCLDGPRPCPYVGCRYHLWLDVTRVGSVRFVHGEDLETLAVLRPSCALDVADERALSGPEVAAVLAVSKQRMRVEVRRALDKLTEEYQRLRAEGEIE